MTRTVMSARQAKEKNNGPAPVVFGTDYVSMGAWWGVGGAVSVINILIWVGVGSVWWSIIGLM